MTNYYPPTDRQPTYYQPMLQKDIDLDDWVCELMQWHFRPETGSPFWLSRKQQLGFDPLTDVKGYADLELFGLFDDGLLKTTPMNDLVPKGFSSQQGATFSVYETGGTLGAPKRIIDHSYRQALAKWSIFALQQHDFNLHQGNWLHLGPAGPHVVGQTTGAIARLNGGLCHYIDIDTRWIKHCVRKGYDALMDEYIEHVLQQALYILETQNISFITTTPKLLPALAKKTSLESIRGIVLGGTHVTTSTHKLIRTRIVPNTPVCIMYGNTLAGVAPQAPFAQEGWDIQHYAFHPHFTLQVVNPEHPTQLVAYGERGRVKICTLTKDYFIPNLLERDEATRIAGSSLYPWDGVANVKPFSQMQETIIEGVY